jgi:hypothetical protein
VLVVSGAEMAERKGIKERWKEKEAAVRKESNRDDFGACVCVCVCGVCVYICIRAIAGRKEREKRDEGKRR